MPIEKLRGICENVVKMDPDLVFLTGDFLTMKVRNTKHILRDSLLPLKQINHKVFACLG